MYCRGAKSKKSIIFRILVFIDIFVNIALLFGSISFLREYPKSVKEIGTVIFSEYKEWDDSEEIVHEISTCVEWNGLEYSFKTAEVMNVGDPVTVYVYDDKIICTELDYDTIRFSEVFVPIIWNLFITVPLLLWNRSLKRRARQERREW